MKYFTITKKNTIKECLIKINKNKKNFLIVLKKGKVESIVTEGDLRRQLISGISIDNKIKYKTKFKFLTIKDNFHTISNLFKSKKINFLPILNHKKELVNILTKKQFHTLLLHDQQWNLENDLLKINENKIDYEIYNRPWGFYKSTLLSNFVQSKIITVFPKSELSLQEHKKREEHWVIIKGKGIVTLGESKIDVYPGKYIYIPKGCKHQVINNSGENIIFSEVQLGEYFGEDDIVRYSDKYGRVK